MPRTPLALVTGPLTTTTYRLALPQAEEEATEREQLQKLKSADSAIFEKVQEEEDKAAAKAEAKKLTDSMTGRSY